MPQRPALKDDGKDPLVYRDMLERTNGIVSQLLSHRVEPGSTVGVFQMPSASWFCSMLAIFHVGAVYLPLDVKNGLPRLGTYVKKCKPAAIIADDETMNDAISLTTSSSVINVNHIKDLGNPPCPNRAHSDADALILFTSGSTGTPEAFSITHAQLVGQIEGFAKEWNISESVEKVLQQSAFSFDFSLHQTFAALANGGCLYIVPASKRGDPLAITRLMADEGITYTAVTPSEYEIFIHAGKENLSRCKSWKVAFFGGEPPTNALVAQFRELDLPLLRLFDSYGPAEITISSTHGEVPYKTMQYDDPIPAGWMLPNYNVIIMDEQRRPLPIGVSGEIVIVGVGVVTGYLQMDALTKAKFIPDVYHPTDPDYINNRWQTLYCTGDRGRLREDGAVFCEGRMDGDTQIKLRGFRIVLNEIENANVKVGNSLVRQAVVSLRKVNDTHILCAHLVLAAHLDEGAQDALLQGIQSRLPLPQYMIPAVFAKLESLPLSAHLKIDRKAIAALPLPHGPAVQENGAEGLSKAETVMGGLWSSVLPLTIQLEGQTDFFNVGGNSLLLVKLQTLIRQRFGVAVKVIDLLQASTLREMARVISDKLDGQYAIDWDTETSLDIDLLRVLIGDCQRRNKSGTSCSLALRAI